ncbi:MAG: PLDc N-terminal domain-containing protein [Bacteroidota bacterium]
MFSFLGSVIGSILTIVWFLLTIGVLFNIWKESKKTTFSKVAWTGFILFAPIFGSIMYMLFGMPRQS